MPVEVPSRALEIPKASCKYIMLALLEEPYCSGTGLLPSMKRHCAGVAWRDRRMEPVPRPCAVA